MTVLTNSDLLAISRGFFFGLPFWLASSSVFLTDRPSSMIFLQSSACTFLSSMGTSALACPDESFPSATNPLISAGSFRSRRELVIYGLLLLTLLDTSSCVKPYVLIICSRPSASSIGFRSSRCIFSMIAISIFSSSENSRIRQGTSFSCAPLAALHLLSPRRIVKRAFCRFVGRRRVKHEAEFFVQMVEEVLRRTPIHFL